MSQIPYLVNRTNICIEACGRIDLKLSNCDFSTGRQTATQCVCLTGGSSQLYIGYLDQCTVCNLDGLGKNPVARYQAWDYVCRVLASSGVMAAEQLISQPSTALAQTWSVQVPTILAAELAATGQILSVTGSSGTASATVTGANDAGGVTSSTANTITTTTTSPQTRVSNTSPSVITATSGTSSIRQSSALASPTTTSSVGGVELLSRVYAPAWVMWMVAVCF